MKGVGITRRRTVTAHLCHAQGCSVAVPPRMLMCRHHWFMVSMVIRQHVWNAYVPGQENSKLPTRAYVEAAKAAIADVASKERAA